MKHLYITSIISIMCLNIISSCNQQEWLENSETEVIISGNSIGCTLSSESNQCFGRATASYLHEGNRISFYSTEGIQSEGQVLTLTKGYWKGESSLLWSKNGLAANVCAYNPPLPPSIESLYQDGQLTDLLIAQQHYPNRAPIALHFEHLFAQINFKVEEQLNQQIKQLIVTPYQVIIGINPYTGELTTDANHTTKCATKYTITSESASRTNTPIQRSLHNVQGNGIYSIIVPPGTNQSIDIEILTNDGHSFHKQLKGQTLVRNQSYLCNIKQKTETIGITNAEDFIAFTYLINGYAYKGRSLKEFGSTKDGVTTYYLNNDIQFTNTEREKIRIIGVDGFNHIFDGQGHKLSNVSMKEERSGDLGLFATIAEKGIVKDLTIDQCITKFTKTGGYSGILCGRNLGQIINCHVRNSEIVAMQYQVGGIVGYNLGTIVNCSLKDFKISLNSKNKKTLKFGGITHSNYGSGTILNCMVTNLRRGSGKNSSKLMACLAYYCNGKVANFISSHSEDIFHPFCKNCNSLCSHCYYPGELNYPLENNSGIPYEDFEKQSILPFWYSSKSLTETANLLNQWIDDEGKKLYPSNNFRRWKVIGNNMIGF